MDIKFLNDFTCEELDTLIQTASAIKSEKEKEKINVALKEVEKAFAQLIACTDNHDTILFDGHYSIADIFEEIKFYYRSHY